MHKIQKFFIKFQNITKIHQQQYFNLSFRLEKQQNFALNQFFNFQIVLPQKLVEEIRAMLIAGKTVNQVNDQLKQNNQKISISTIYKIKNNLESQNAQQPIYQQHQDLQTDKQVQDNLMQISQITNDQKLMLSDITDEQNQTVGIISALQNKKLELSVIEKGKQVQHDEFDSSTASFGTTIDKIINKCQHRLSGSDICIVTDNDKLKENPITVHGSRILEGIKVTDKIQVLTCYYAHELNASVVSIQYEQQQEIIKCLLCNKDKNTNSYSIHPLQIQNMIMDSISQKTLRDILTQHQNNSSQQKIKLQCLKILINNIQILFPDHVIVLIGDIQQVQLLKDNIVNADERYIIEGTQKWLTIQAKEQKQNQELYTGFIQSPPVQMFSSYFVDREENESRTLKIDVTPNLNKQQTNNKFNQDDQNQQQMQE